MPILPIKPIFIQAHLIISQVPITCSSRPGHPKVTSAMVAAIPPVRISSPRAPMSRLTRTTPTRMGMLLCSQSCHKCQNHELQCHHLQDTPSGLTGQQMMHQR